MPLPDDELREIRRKMALFDRQTPEERQAFHERMADKETADTEFKLIEAGVAKPKPAPKPKEPSRRAVAIRKIIEHRRSGI